MAAVITEHRYSSADVEREVRFWIRQIQLGLETLDTAFTQCAVTEKQRVLLIAHDYRRAVEFRDNVCEGLRLWSVTGIVPFAHKEDAHERQG